MNCIVLYCIVYLLSSDGHVDRVIFYNNEGIKLSYHGNLLRQRGGDELECEIIKASRFFRCVLI